MNTFASNYGHWLYEVLPALYRESDQPRKTGELGDLARYLDACGVLLDQLRATLDQRLADSFADNPAAGPACQEWLLPYFARLLDVTVVAPDLKSRRDEVSMALRWRQRKGTRVAAEEVCESVVGAEAELQEGWQRVARTPRVGEPLLPAAAWGLADAAVQGWPSRAVQHPSLPAVTIDLRRSSMAVRSSGAPGLATRRSRLGGINLIWQQAYVHGAPRQPGAFDDVSRRTVDLRPPSPTTGLAHPRRVLAYTALPQGRFAPPADHLADVAALRASLAVEWTQEPPAPSAGQACTLSIRRRATHDVVLDSGLDLGPLLPPGNGDVLVQIEGLQVRGSVHLPRGRLQLTRVVASVVTVDSASAAAGPPVLQASDCLIGDLRVPAGAAQLQGCTVRRDTRCGGLDAVNTLFHGVVEGPQGQLQPAVATLQHCRIPPALQAGPQILLVACCSDEAMFFASSADDTGPPVLGPDAGVLRPDNPAAILHGADNGGELGCGNGGRAGAPVVMQRAQEIRLALTAVETLSDLVFASTLHIHGTSARTLLLERVAVKDLRVASTTATDAQGRAAPSLDAQSCLFGELFVRPGLARLEFCTVLGRARTARLQASECLFAGTLQITAASADAPHALRYCRLPAGNLGATGLPQFNCTAAPPVFYSASFDAGLAGTPGCGVLHWAAPQALQSGAEDGGEIGAYHEDRHVLRMAAARDKLLEHLPAGMVPLLLPDPRLALVPPLPTASNVPGGL